MKKSAEQLQQQIKGLETAICSIPVYGESLSAQFYLIFEGDNNDLPVFGFIENTTVRKELQAVCYEIFLDYFPNGIIKT